jgi:predicted ATP-dependent serine protease
MNLVAANVNWRTRRALAISAVSQRRLQLSVRGQDVRVSKARGMRMVELPQKIRPAFKAGLIGEGRFVNPT